MRLLIQAFLFNDMNEKYIETEDDENLKNRVLTAFKTCKLDMETLQADRAKADKFYNAKALGNEKKGRSQIIIPSLSNTVEWMLPGLMRIFYSGEDVVDINPIGAEDELKSKLMKSKVNFDFKNAGGFKLLYTFFKDALLYKQGVIKYGWKRQVTHKYHEMILDVASVAAMQANPNYIIDVLEETSPGEYRVEARQLIKKNEPVYWNVPPEEWIFDMKMKAVDDPYGFCCHRIPMSKEKAKSLYKITDDELNGEIKKFTDDPIIQERYKDVGGADFIGKVGSTTTNDSDIIYVNECYLYQYDDDGNDIPWIVTIIGERVVKKELNKYGKPPFAVISPILVQHRMLGHSIFDIVEQFQLLATSLIRGVMDNIYYSNNGINIVNQHRIKFEEYLNNRVPGGTITTRGDVDPSSAVFQLPFTQLPGQVFRLVESIVPEMLSDATGITKYNQGLDSKSLNKTATGISQIMGAAQQRMELLARIFAETGVTDLFKAAVDMNLQFFNGSMNIKLDNRWVQITPDQISGEYDISIDVGIGTGSKEIKFNQMGMMLDRYSGIANTIKNPADIQQIFTIENVKAIIKEMWENLGYKNTSKFLTPESVSAQRQPMGGMARGTIV